MRKGIRREKPEFVILIADFVMVSKECFRVEHLGLNCALSF